MDPVAVATVVPTSSPLFGAVFRGELGTEIVTATTGFHAVVTLGFTSAAATASPESSPRPDPTPDKV